MAYTKTTDGKTHGAMHFPTYMGQDWIRRIIQAWQRYWFGEVPATCFAFSRIAFGFILILYHAPRLFYVRELYTEEGYVVPMDLFRALDLPIPDFGTALLLNIILQAAIISFIVGYHTRVATFVVLALHTYFSQLEYFSTFGLGTIMMIYLILFLFAPAGVFLSVDYALSRRRSSTPPLVPVTMQRVMLWQLAAIYFFNVLSKLKYGSWLDGKELWLIYMNVGEGTYSFMPRIVNKVEWILPNIEVMTIVGLFLLGGGILIPLIKPYALTFGFVYHTVAIFTVAIPVTFSLLMLALYVTAVEPSTWQRWWEWITQRITSWK